MESKIMTAGEFMHDYMYKKYSKYRTDTQFEQPSHEDCIDMLNQYVEYRIKSQTPDKVEQAIEAEYSTLHNDGSAEISWLNDVQGHFKGIARKWYAIGRSGQLEWIDADVNPPVEHQPCAFIVESRDEHYNGRIFGGTYQGRRGGVAYHEFAVPGIGFKATLWQSLPAAPAVLTDRKPE